MKKKINKKIVDEIIKKYKTLGMPLETILDTIFLKLCKITSFLGSVFFILLFLADKIKSFILAIISLLK